jgi:hypothetical protein
MLTRRFLVKLPTLLLVLAALAACTAEPTPSPTWTPTNLPTSIPLTSTLTPSVTPTLFPSSTPFPTFTLPPSLTPVPSLTPTPAIIGLGTNSGPFRDDFSDPFSGWPTSTGADWGFGYEGEVYEMYNNLPSAEVCSSRTRWHTDYVVEVDAAKIAGPDNAYFGVSCRKSGDSFYTLGIRGNGEYAIYKTTGSTRKLVAGGVSAAVRQGNATNRLSASCVGSVLTLWVNGTQVVSVLDIGPQFGSFIGLVIGTINEGGLIVHFDNFNGYPSANARPIPTITPTGTLPTSTPGTITPTVTSTP